jgi:hypothetical protein
MGFEDRSSWLYWLRDLLPLGDKASDFVGTKWHHDT